MTDADYSLQLIVMRDGETLGGGPHMTTLDRCVVMRANNCAITHCNLLYCDIIEQDGTPVSPFSLMDEDARSLLGPEVRANGGIHYKFAPTTDRRK